MGGLRRWISVSLSFALVAAVVCAAPQTPATEARVQTGFLDRSIVLKGEPLRYQVYVPADYAQSKAWPVVLYLHGNGRQGADGTRQTNGGFADALRQDRSQFPAIVVFAQTKDRGSWSDALMHELALEELDRTIREFAVDPSRSYLVGYSMGGSGAYRLLYRWPDRFVAAIVVAGRVGPNLARDAAAQQVDRNENPFLAEQNPFAALAGRIKRVPLWIFHGDADMTVNVEQSRKVVTPLKAAGAPVKYTEFAGASHVEAPQKAFAGPAVFTWLLEQRRTATGR